MTEIMLLPGERLEDREYEADVTIIATSTNLAITNSQEDEITFNILNCSFNNLTIRVHKILENKRISLRFHKCIIQNFQGEQRQLLNTSLFFYVCLLAGKVDNFGLIQIRIEDCFIINSIHILHRQNLHVSMRNGQSIAYQLKTLLCKSKIADLGENKKISQQYFIYAPNIMFFALDKVDAISELTEIKLLLDYDAHTENSYTEIKNTTLQSLELRGASQGKIEIENVLVNELIVSEFYPKKEVNLYNIVADNKKENRSSISIYQSNLDNVWFDSIYFDEFSHISFCRTKFSKTIFTSCNFPNEYRKFSKFQPVNAMRFPNAIAINYDKDQYEMFLQLKNALTATGNYYEAQKLQSIVYEVLRRIKDISIWDKAILLINRISNNHGLSIKRPFIGFFISSIIIYILYLYSIGCIFNLGVFDKELFGYYFSFIDLTHRSDFLVDKTRLTSWALFLDFFNKIISGFFIYQFIAAFRKYGKG